MVAKTLAELEELDLYAQKEHQELKQLLDQGKMVTFIKQVPKLSHEMTFKLANKDSEFHQAFAHHNLTNHWAKETKRFNQTAANVVGIELINRSNFDIFLSYYLLSEYYRYADEHKINNRDALQLLSKACEYQGIHALQKRADILVQRIDQINHDKKSTEEFSDKLAQRCDVAMHEIADLWSPGLMEASRLGLELGIYYLKYRNVLPAENQETYREYYRVALRYIFLAQKLENTSQSQHATHVIYQNRPILTMYRMAKWNEMAPWLLKYHPLKQEDITKAQTEADIAYKKIASSVKM